MPFEARLELDIDRTIRRFSPRYENAQAFIDQAVLKDSSPYVPFDTGALSGSGQAAAEGGQVAYTAPYARRMYHGDGFHFNAAVHPLACAHWFEKAKAANKAAWTDGAQKALAR